MKPNLLTLLKNLALLAFVALPLFFALVWIQALLGRPAGATNFGYMVEAGGVYYLSNVIPVLVGGLVHQVIWLILPIDWPSARRKVVAFLLTPLIPIAVLLSWGGPASTFLDFTIPMILALAIYVLLIRPDPSKPSTA